LEQSQLRTSHVDHASDATHVAMLVAGVEKARATAIVTQGTLSGRL